MKAAYDIRTVIAAAAKALPVWEAKYDALAAEKVDLLAEFREAEARRDAGRVVTLLNGRPLHDPWEHMLNASLLRDIMEHDRVPQLRICKRLAAANPQGVQYVVLDDEEIEAIKPGLELVE